MSVLVVLRGNSGSGKTTTARVVQECFNRAECLVVSQDTVRRIMLRERDEPAAINIDPIEHIARFGLRHQRVVIVEGILDADRDSPMQARLAAAATHALHYCVDLNFEETLTRSRTAPAASRSTRAKASGSSTATASATAAAAHPLPHGMAVLSTPGNHSAGWEHTVIETKPSTIMARLGIVQAGADILAQPARAFDLPGDADTATAVVEDLFNSMDRVARVHTFAKGMGIAAPQIGIDRRAAIVRPADPHAPAIILLNPRVTAESDETDEQYEGCLSFFDVRGLVPRPLHITVETTTLTGELVITDYHHGLARLLYHELDHLDGSLYTARMRPGITPIPVEEYRLSGQNWTYEQ